MKKALLFINGEPPKNLVDFSKYDLVACTDGALDYLLKFDSEIVLKLDFISGDFDSHIVDDFNNEKFIETPDQNKTDFQKALELILEKGIINVDVFGASGGEMDHFLGNLSVADFMKSEMNIRFFDEFSSYYFIPKSFTISDVKDKMISLFPFPKAESITTKGLKWPLYKENLKMGERIGTRNLAENDSVSIEYKKGNLLIFVGH
ncbi:thiamine diphosphokinase [Soonwooa sp.]|uniref:thiamine diphosphokinase n=1 Tax=Soonwooa sp. TaxID=1938592 RepID=UPI002622D37F|nr:thiamine diphosphokinase [Soonwooa sp.]